MFRFSLVMVIALILFGVAVAPGIAQAPQPNPQQRHQPAYVPGEILVKFHPSVDNSSGQNRLRLAGWRPLQVAAHSGLMRVQTPPGQEAAAITQLRARRDVEFAGLNIVLTASETPNDPDFASQWALNNSGQSGGSADADIDAPTAWDIETGKSGIVIAIVDSGVDLDHPDLIDNLSAGYDFVNNDNQPDDDYGHGTHVAGIAAAVGNNNLGLTGVSWASKIMPVKVLNSFGAGTIFNVAQGIDYAVANGADIINLSLGLPFSAYPDCVDPANPSNLKVIETAIQNAVSQGVVVIAAAGNQNFPKVNCPAAFDEAIAVGATNHNDDRWLWNGSQGSNYENRLDVVAPGGSESSSNLDTGIYSTAKGGGYEYQSGTSMATPFVSGLAALLLSHSPNLNPGDTRSIIEVTADDLGAAGFDDFYGHGRINAAQALAAANNLQTSAGQTDFVIDDSLISMPSSTIHITSFNPTPVDWTATASPTVTWLDLAPATAGTVSAGAPVELTLAITQPQSYGLHSATVIVSGDDLGARSTTVDLNYLPIDLQASAAQIGFQISDDSSLPLVETVQISSTALAPITWTVQVSPGVSWLEASPLSGAISAASLPVDLTLAVTRPNSYGHYNTGLIITGLDASGLPLATENVQVTMSYRQYQYLPIIQKN